MMPAKLAPVKPRVLSPVTGEALPLADEIHPFLEAGARGSIQLLGPPGSGKTTALQHLAAVLPPEAGVVLLDDPTGGEVLEYGAERLVVFAAASPQPGPHLATLQMAPWGDDERIEYLMAVHKDRCASVMARLRDGDYLFSGIAEVWRILLDELAADGSILNARGALYRYLESQLPDTDLLERARSACLNALATGDPVGAHPVPVGKPGFGNDLVRVLRHPPVQLVLATERVAADLNGEADCDFLALRLPRDLVRSAAAAAAGDERALAHLHRLITGPSWSHAMAASILHALHIGWVPGDPGGPPILAGAYLEGAAWPGVRLAEADLHGADLSHADLRGANLDGANVRQADLRQARLEKASLNKSRLVGTNLDSADLTAVRAAKACWDGANLEGATLEGASLAEASFGGARLARANFAGAQLVGANFAGAHIKRADFSGANLEEASLSGLPLREATFAGAGCARATLTDCDLEGMELPGADFNLANLAGALLTGSSMPRADFTNAKLTGAGLAEVDWEGASLRGADLRGATFHLGTSRSGLVFSPIASEGSRTGFYTDDYNEQDFKAPEDIRKANLCGADLRGARVEDVDFYLVDLRDARYDPEQAEHFRRCRAILGVRV
jgi:uncharacterized protein YjbI with pentapeptide repeats